MLKLVRYPDPILDSVAEPVTEFNDELINIANEMFIIMKNNNGIGLSGPQVGLSKRIFVMETNRVQRIVVNPKITNKSGLGGIEEGCLSFPGINVKVSRPTIISVEYSDLSGNNIVETLYALDAICFQHELDHLDGITLANYLSKTVRSYIMKRLERERNERGEQDS